MGETQKAMKNKKPPKGHPARSAGLLSRSLSRVYKTLLSLSKRQDTVVRISLRALAKKVGPSYSTTRRAVLLLKKRGTILYFPGKNQWITSSFLPGEPSRSPETRELSQELIHRKPRNLSWKTTSTPEARELSQGVIHKRGENLSWKTTGSAKVAEPSQHFIHRKREKLSQKTIIPPKSARPSSQVIHRRAKILSQKTTSGETEPPVIHRISKSLPQKTNVPPKISESANVNVNNKYILNNVNDNVSRFTSASPETLASKERKELLAFEIARMLDDEKNLALYLKYCQEYPEAIIIRAFKKAMGMPDEKIKRTRGAFFTYLVKKYAQKKNNQNLRN